MPIKEVIEKYLSVIASTETDEEARIEHLALSLDELALVTHGIKYVFDDTDYPDSPAKNYDESCKKVATLFPSLGYYNTALDVCAEPKKSEICVCSAIDDIVDIAHDLQEFLWRFENTSEADALFHLEFSFKSHWGAHLRNLQLYLHNLIHWPS